MHLGTKRVYTINPDSIEHNTAYKGSEFGGNGLYFPTACGVAINGTEMLRVSEKGVIYIADNYYYQFEKETVLSQVIMQVPNLGVSESTVNTNDVALAKNNETEIVSHTMSSGIGEIAAGGGTLELSMTLLNTEGQDAKADIRIYDDGVEIAFDADFKVPKNDGIANYFVSANIPITLGAESVLTASVDMDKVGTALADITLLIRKET